MLYLFHRFSPFTIRIVIPRKGFEEDFRRLSGSQKLKESYSFLSRLSLSRAYRGVLPEDCPLQGRSQKKKHGFSEVHSQRIHTDFEFDSRIKKFLFYATSGKADSCRRVYEVTHRRKAFGVSFRSLDAWLEDGFKLPFYPMQPLHEVFYNEFEGFYGFVFEDRSNLYFRKHGGNNDACTKLEPIRIRDFYFSFHGEDAFNRDAFDEKGLKRIYREAYPYKGAYRKIFGESLYPRDSFDLSMLEYALVFGSPLLPPFITLGLWYSKWAELSEDDFLQIVETFKRRDYPVSVLVVDTDWRAPSENFGRWRGYRWDPNFFPKPERFFKRIKERHPIVVGLNDHPGYGEEHYVEEFGRAIDWYSQSDQEQFSEFLADFLVKYNLDFWWVDGWGYEKYPGLDSQLVINHIYFKGVEKSYDKRGTCVKTKPFILSRFGGPGASRYTYAFSGDVFSTEDYLKREIELTLLSASALPPHWSHDTGGFMSSEGFGTGKIDPVLFARWVRFTALSPSFRLHSSGGPREPYLYGRAFEAYFRFFYRLRLSLSLFFYEKMFETYMVGKPLLVPPSWKIPSRHGSISIEEIPGAGPAILIGETLLYFPLVESDPLGKKTSKIFKDIEQACRKHGFYKLLSSHDVARASRRSHGNKSSLLSDFMLTAGPWLLLIKEDRTLPVIAPEDFHRLAFHHTHPDEIKHLNVGFLSLGGKRSFRFYFDDGAYPAGDFLFADILVEDSRVLSVQLYGNLNVDLSFDPVKPIEWLAALL